MISGVGYRAAMDGKILNLQLGYSHDIKYAIPATSRLSARHRPRFPYPVPIGGVGQIAAEIARFRKPEPYKGKGIRYDDERIIRKEGKKKIAMIKPAKRFDAESERTRYALIAEPIQAAAIRAMARSSAHQKHIYAQMIDDQAGQPWLRHRPSTRRWVEI